MVQYNTTHIFLRCLALDVVNRYSKMTLRPRVITDSSKAECLVYSLNEVQYPHTRVVDMGKMFKGFQLPEC